MYFIVSERKSPQNVPLVKRDLLKPISVGETKNPWNLPSMNKIYSNFHAALNFTDALKIVRVNQIRWNTNEVRLDSNYERGQIDITK